MVETRIAPRYRASKAATIVSGDGAIDCTVRDLSITGAALTVSNHAGIPRKFILVVPSDGLRLPCHLVWRRGYRMGVAFD
jgi:hypothetical protein